MRELELVGGKDRGMSSGPALRLFEHPAQCFARSFCGASPCEDGDVVDISRWHDVCFLIACVDQVCVVEEVKQRGEW